MNAENKPEQTAEREEGRRRPLPWMRLIFEHMRKEALQERDEHIARGGHIQ